MKIILSAINSKFSHTNPAIRLLNAYSGYKSEIMEFTINEQPDYIIFEIYNRKPDIICFSAYIWNIELVTKCARVLSLVLPNAKIVLGGPEVSYDAKAYLEKHSFIDAIIIGEGESSFKALVDNDFDFKNTLGVSYRSDDSIITNPPAAPIMLDDLPYVYTDEELDTLADKLLYYESSRGCPYSCSYCLSSTLHSLRFKSVEKVKEELKRFIDKKVRIVKFIDRTFNADEHRAYEIFKFLIDNASSTRFHFEISAHILTDEVLKLLSTAPDGLFQFEIGVQSTNEKTISEISRKTDFNKLSENVGKLLSFKNIHLHLDLIAGLPYEDFNSFKKSFNDVFCLKPDMLQLGFLKLLKGTRIREEKDKHGYVFSLYPPYEYLENKYISYSETLKLKGIENMVDKFYNSQKFSKSIERLCTFFSSPFDMFYELSNFYRENGYNKISISQKTLYSILADFLKLHADELTLELLKFDYYHLGHANTAPEWADKNDISKMRFELIETYRNSVFSSFGDTPAKEIVKHLIFEKFSYNIETQEKKDCIICFFKTGEFKILD